LQERRGVLSLRRMFISIGQKPKVPVGDVVGLLLECHGRIRSFTALALQLGARDNVPAAELMDGCLRCERYFTEALPLHVRDEEESLLPRLRGLGAELDAALTAMHGEHHAHEGLIDGLLAASRALREAPKDAQRREELARAASRLGAEMDAHLAREEALIFPAVRALLPPQAQSEVLNELRARRNER
jgi:iron-sulfur cluster repair protein YtfE (RIC family)